MSKRVHYTGKLARQLDIPSSIDRTVEGSFHLRPGRVHVFTDGELAFAQSKYAGLKGSLRVIGEAAGAVCKSVASVRGKPRPGSDVTEDVTEDVQKPKVRRQKAKATTT